jgi:2-polyprenyl-6-methoxyphenol hydroxylase-like FAD-dependent oxidoreductase
MGALMAAERPVAVVVGGGIAGLASAIALSQADWQVTVLERAPGFVEVGAGLSISGNGMAALTALGLDQAVRAVACQTATAGYQDLRGRWLMRLPDTKHDPDAITTIWGVHRQRLHSALRSAAEAADGVTLVTNAEVTAIRPGLPAGEQALVTWGTETAPKTAEADLVVAADGVRSAVRAQLFPAAYPHYSGYTSWRGVVSDTTTADSRLVQALGPGAEFGAMRISDSETYWYGYCRSPESAVLPDEPAAARDRFATWAGWIRELIAATPASSLVRHDVYHLPTGPAAYTSGRVVLTGDAAHAALPTSGQGSATAFEDAVCVGRMVAAPVSKGGDMAAALTAYDQTRRPRCERIVRTGVMISRFGADVGAGLPQTIRNAVLRLTPAGPLIRFGAPVVRWTPP